MKRYAILTVGILLMATGAFAATGTGDATAKILDVITIVEDQALNFGTIAPGTLASTVRVTNAGVRSLTAGDAILITDATNTPSEGQFTITGQGAYTYSISAAVTADLTCVAPCTGPAMPLGNLSLTAATGSGVTTLGVGGDLSVAAGQDGGDYTGEVTITANYQ